MILKNFCRLATILDVEILSKNSSSLAWILQARLFYTAQDKKSFVEAFMLHNSLNRNVKCRLKNAQENLHFAQKMRVNSPAHVGVQK